MNDYPWMQIKITEKFQYFTSIDKSNPPDIINPGHYYNLRLLPFAEKYKTETYMMKLYNPS